jgi:hypothetical protein
MKNRIMENISSFNRTMIRANLMGAILLLAIAASANIPSGHVVPIPETKNQTRCEKYLATQPADRIDQWILTFQQALRNSPKLEQDVLECILDLYKMSETDQFMVRACRKNQIESFKDLVWNALRAHLDKCEAGITR